jgi:hypothetical protein
MGVGVLEWMAGVVADGVGGRVVALTVRIWNVPTDINGLAQKFDSADMAYKRRE